MALLLVCALGAGGYFYLCTPVRYISIDVNPSIEFSLNRLNRVLSAQAWNADGEIVLQDAHVVGLLYTQAIDALLESAAMEPYLIEDAVLSFTIAADSEKSEALLMNGIGACSGCRKYRGQNYCADAALIQEAHQAGMSFGKYRTYQALLEQGYDVSAETCRSMSMAEIRALGGQQGDGNRKHRNRKDACPQE